jgi:hypothetical protein
LLDQRTRPIVICKRHRCRLAGWTSW